MEELIGKVELLVRGETFEAGIERITARPADPSNPWHKEDSLDVWLTFERGEGKYPGSTLGFGVSLPVKDYQPDELLALIKTEGERQLEGTQVLADEYRAIVQAKETRQRELDTLVSQLTSSLIGGPATRRNTALEEI